MTKFADPKYAPYFVEVAKAYEAANPGVKVDLQQVGDQPYKDKIRVLSASKQLPDVYFSWAGDFANKFVRAGLAADLTSVLGPDTEWGKTFSPAALKAFQTGGKNYGVPIDLDAKYLAYNKAAFAKAGVTAPPATLRGPARPLRQAQGRRLHTDRLRQPVRLAGHPLHDPAQRVLVAPGPWPRTTTPRPGAFTDPGYVQALDQFQSIVKPAATRPPTVWPTRPRRPTSSAARRPCTTWSRSSSRSLTEKGGASKQLANNWGFFRLPAPSGAAGDPSALTGAPDGFMVNRQSKQAALAVDFLKFMTDQDNAQKMTTGPRLAQRRQGLGDGRRTPSRS